MIAPVVIKIGGSTLGSHDTTLEDLVTLQKRGQLPVVVHGGAKRVTQWLQKQGTPTRFVDGLRVTDDEALQMVAAVIGGVVNTDLVAVINALGGKAFGMTGVDGNLIESVVKNPDMGYVGKISRVNPAAVEALLKAGFIPLIAPPCAKTSEVDSPVSYLNVNGDDIAGALAASLGAERLVFLTDVEGIRDGDGKLISKTTVAGVKALMQSGVIVKGMIPKAQAALLALGAGARTVQIIDGRMPHALIDAIDGKFMGTTII